MLLDNGDLKELFDLRFQMADSTPIWQIVPLNLAQELFSVFSIRKSGLILEIQLIGSIYLSCHILHSYLFFRYSSRVNYDVACNMDFHRFPVDEQTCIIKYESFGYTTKQVCQSRSGAAAERVQQVHLHPSIFGNGCIAPVLRSPYYQNNNKKCENLAALTPN